MNPPLKKAKLSGKKRTRQEASSGSGSSLLDLSAENLSTLTSLKLEEIAQQLADTRPLTSEEEKHLKRQRRLIKNRESAQLSRQKRKQYVEELESRVKALLNETEQLRSKVQESNQKTQKLEQQVVYLQSLVKQGHTAVSQDTKGFNKHSTATAGLCMFVILFSFGLFFTASPIAGPQAALAFNRPPRYASSGRFITTSLTFLCSAYTGRTLAGLPAIEAPPAKELTAKRTAEEASVEYPAPKRARISEESQEVSWLGKEDGWETSRSAKTVTSNGGKTSQLIVRPPGFVKEKPTNSTYIFCSEAHEVSSPIVRSEQGSASVITLLLPASALNGSIPVENFVDDPENSLFEVSCQVLNIAVFPYYPTVDHLISNQQRLSSQQRLL